MSANHTPGPWILGDENNQCCEVLLGVEHNLTADLDRQDSNTGKLVIGRDEMRANARLIAAAPELLAAVESFLDMWHRAGPQGSHQFEKFDGVVRDCEIAIEKAGK